MKPLNQFPKHKRKKIEYIRTKFRLKKGLSICRSSMVVSNDIDETTLAQVVISESNKQIKTLHDIWKLHFTFRSLEAGLCNDDFLSQTTTLLFSYNVC